MHARKRMMTGIGTLSLLLGLLASSADAQTATPSSRLAWDQPAGTLAEASGYTYEATFDGAPVAPLTGVTCAGTSSPFICSAAFPALTPTSHTVQIAARNTAGASPLSAVFSFTFVALPQAPTNLRIVTGQD